MNQSNRSAAVGLVSVIVLASIFGVWHSIAKRKGSDTLPGAVSPAKKDKTEEQAVLEAGSQPSVGARLPDRIPASQGAKPSSLVKEKRKVKAQIAFDKYIDDPYANSEVIDMEKTREDNEGNYTRWRVVKTSFKYPYLRIEEKVNRNIWDGQEQVLSRFVMVADHVMVKLENGYSEEDLKTIASRHGGQLLKSFPLSELYLVSFDGKNVHAMEKMIALLQRENKIKVAEPDYIQKAR